MAALASPLHFRAHAARRTATKFRAEQQREDEQKWQWVIPKKEAEYSTSAQSAGTDDKRPDKQKLERASPKNEVASPVPPRGSVLLLHCGTKRAGVANRSVAVQTADSVEHEDSLWGWLTTSTTMTTATQTSAPEALQRGAPSNR